MNFFKKNRVLLILICIVIVLIVVFILVNILYSDKVVSMVLSNAPQTYEKLIASINSLG
jgi:ABC-type dipeptide/oligopeptide/nickel transport system permease component